VRARARGKLTRRERLRHVVVRAELQPDDPIRLVPPSRDQDHGQIRPSTQPAAELEAVGTREHHVENDERGLLALDQLARDIPVPCLPRLVALTLEVGDHDLLHDGLVVHDEDGAHAPN
jgi:hypothetical protein